MNARSINSIDKINKLHHLLDTVKYDIVCITESWLDSSTPNSVLLHDCDYSIFRKDRPSDKIGGGVCILTKNSTITAVHVPLPGLFNGLEIVCIDILSSASASSTKLTLDFRLMLCYRPPSSNTATDSVQYASLMCQCIEAMYPPNSVLLLCGDFNLPKISWSNTRNILCNDATVNGRFIDLYYKLSLHQFVHEPTRLGYNSQNNSLLDLIFSNDSNFVHDVVVGPPFASSDHCIVDFRVISNSSYTTDNSHDPYLVRNFNKSDWQSIFTYFNNIDFFSVFNDCTTAESVVGELYSIIYRAIDLFVPLESYSVSDKTRYPVYLRKLLNSKRTAYRRYCRFRTQQCKTKYNQAASKYRSAVYKYHVKRENNIINSGNINKFYRYANRRFRSNGSVGPLKSPDGSTVIDPTLKAELLQTVFSSMFVQDNGVIPPNSIQYNTTSTLNSIRFTSLSIHKIIKKLKNKSKGGPDGVPPIFIKKCSTFLSMPLAFIYNLCMNSNYIPPIWLGAYITPIFKKGDPCLPSNYRPISLTCSFCKIMECAIKDELINFLLTNDIITKQQHGFLRSRSTTTNLIETINDWSIALISRNNVDAVYIDFSRAFDSIVHSKLLFKLRQCGIDGALLNWISSFLSNRSQHVVLSNCFSSTKPVISGVVQGSVLGPTLFLVFINDLCKICCGNTKLILFADDAKLYAVINLNTSSLDLQQSLDLLSTWSVEWQLFINIVKCHSFSICIRGSTILNNSYRINGIDINRLDSVNDLGILLDSNLDFTTHISNIVSKASQRSAIFFKGFVSRNLKTSRKTFVTYIRPCLEYNTVIWSPTKVYLIDKIEGVQRKFTKRIPCLSHLSYQDRLTRLKLDSLEVRRLRFDLIQYYKIINKLTPFDPNDFFKFYEPRESSRLSTPFLTKNSHVTEQISSLLMHRSIDCWNCLPHDVKNACSLSSFKSKIVSIDFSNFLRGRAIR